MAISQFHSYSESSYLADQVLADRPPSNGDFTDSVKFLFHSYSDSSTFGRPVLGRSNPPHQWQFHRFLLYSESSYLADQVLADQPPSSMAISQIPALTAHYSESSYLADQLWQIYPHIKWQFHRFLWNSYFIPTLRAQHLADQVLADLPPIKYWFHRLTALTCSYLQITHIGRPTDLPIWMAISQIPALTAHISFLLWAHIWQTKVLADLPPIKWQFHRFLWNSYFIPTLRAQHLADLCWQISPPMVISQIPALTVHISLLWELIIWQTRSWQIYPLIKGNFTDSCSPLRAHIWQTKCWQIYPLTIAISQIPALPQLIFGRPSVGRSTPTSNGNFTDSCEIHISFLLWELNIWQTKLLADLPPIKWLISQMTVYRISHCYLQITSHCTYRSPPFEWQFHRFLLWQLIFHSYLRAHHLADQVLADLPPIKWWFYRFLFISFLLWELIIWQTSLGRSTPPSNGNFTDSCSSSLLWELIFGRPSVGRSTSCQMAILQISALTAHISFLLWQLTFGRPGLGRSTAPHQMAISQIPTLPWELIFGRPSVGRSTPTSNGNFTDPCEILISFLL